MNSKILFWILVTSGAILEIIGDIFFKKWSMENNTAVTPHLMLRKEIFTRIFEKNNNNFNYKNMKITICGSMTASKKMLEVETELKNSGHEIFMPEFANDYAKLDNTDTIHAESAKNKIEHNLIKSHFKKIDMSDAVLVVNMEKKGVAGYIGGNSFLEMGHAFGTDKKIYLLNDIPEMPYTDELKAMTPIVINSDLSFIK